MIKSMVYIIAIWVVYPTFRYRHIDIQIAHQILFSSVAVADASGKNRNTLGSTQSWQWQKYTYEDIGKYLSISMKIWTHKMDQNG